MPTPRYPRRDTHTHTRTGEAVLVLHPVNVLVGDAFGHVLRLETRSHVLGHLVKNLRVRAGAAVVRIHSR